MLCYNRTEVKVNTVVQTSSAFILKDSIFYKLIVSSAYNLLAVDKKSHELKRTVNHIDYR